MDGVALLLEAQGAGLTVEAVAGRLRIRGPRKAEPIALRLLANKAAVLAALAAVLPRGHGNEQAPQPGRDYPAWWDEPLPDAQQRDGELLLARQLAKDWAATRAELERLVLDVANRKGWPRIQLGQGIWLLPGQACWQRYASNPCTKPNDLVRALEALHGEGAAG